MLAAIVTPIEPIRYNAPAGAIQRACGRSHASAAHTISTRHSSAVANSAVMNSGVIASRLIDCMAAIPWSGASWSSPCMMNVEKAKKMPETRPQTSAVMRMSVGIGHSKTDHA